jgi:hypothetical protein
MCHGLDDCQSNGAKVTFAVEKAGSGWDAPPLAGWLRPSVNRPRRLRSVATRP